MVGHEEDKIRPAVILHCAQRAYCKMADRILRTSDEWRSFIARYKLFLLMTAARAPSRIGNDGHGLEDVLVRRHKASTSRHEASLNLFGAAISFYSENSDLIPSHHTSTLGGIVLLDGVHRGLTVAHAINTPGKHHDDFADQNLDSASDEVFTFGDNDEDADFIFNGQDPVNPGM